MGGLGRILAAGGDLRSATDLYRQMLETRRELYGEDDPSTLGAMTGLATALHLSGEREEAQALYEQVLARRRVLLGEDHPKTAAARRNLERARRTEGGADAGLDDERPRGT